MQLNKHEELLSKRRLTMLTGSDDNLLDEDLESEEIIEGLTTFKFTIESILTLM